MEMESSDRRECLHLLATPEWQAHKSRAYSARPITNKLRHLNVLPVILFFPVTPHQGTNSYELLTL